MNSLTVWHVVHFMRGGVGWLATGLLGLTAALFLIGYLVLGLNGISIHRRLEFSPNGAPPLSKAQSSAYDCIACGPEWAESALLDDDELTVKIHDGSCGRRTPAAILLVRANKKTVPTAYGYYLNPTQLTKDRLTIDVVHFEGDYDREVHDKPRCWPVAWCACEQDAWVGQGLQAKKFVSETPLGSYSTVKNTYVIPKSDLSSDTLRKLRKGELVILVAFWFGKQTLPTDIDTLFPIIGKY